MHRIFIYGDRADPVSDGLNVGFAPVGNLLGSGLTDGWLKWLMVPVGILIGYYIVKAEQAVQLLNEQVEDLTGGAISHKMMNASLSLGVACAVALSMVRVLSGISIYWITVPYTGTGAEPACPAGFCRYRF